MTKAEITRQRRMAQSWGHYREDSRTVSYACPLAEKLDRECRHRITVWHQPWEKVSATMVQVAFESHYLGELIMGERFDPCPYAT